MVAGSGLTFIELPNRTFALQEAGSSQDGDVLLDEVVIVEGERSGRTLSETPASTVVISGEEADRPQNLNTRSIANEIPNVVFEDGNSLLPAVRGIDGSAGQVGAGAATTGAQPRVNVIVDGITRSSNLGGTAGSVATLWDTEQVEVARGPQSTLGGRNSLAGNIRIQTKDPVHRFEGAVRGFGFSQDGTFGGAGLLNIPVIQDQVALRVTAEGSAGENFLEFVNPIVFPDVLEEDETQRYRAKLLITPDAIPDLEIVALYERNESLGLFSQIADPGAFITSTANGLSVNDNTQNVFGLRATFDLTDKIDIEARGSFVDNRFDLPVSALTGFAAQQDIEDISFEGIVRFEDIGRFNRGVFGVNYERQNEDGATLGFLDFTFEGESRTIGIFGEAEIGITDKLALIAGARVEIDDRTRMLDNAGNVAILDIEETAFIPRVGLRYDHRENVSFGYQFSDGFRPGGLDFDLFDPTAEVVFFGSERLRQHEIYSRSNFLDGRATLNASAFVYFFDDAQIAGAGGVTVFGGGLFGNVPSARGFGAEIEGSYEVLPGLTASGGIGLLDTEITDAGPIAPGLEGTELPRASNLTFNLGLTYVSDVGFDASVRVRHVGENFGVQTGAADDLVPSFTVVDINAGYDFEIDDKRSFRIEGFVNNVNNDRIILSSIGVAEVVGRPRTFGISGTVEF
ncbi:MAG: TonB-dependent receptor [Pseudomonadota bacterium]